MYRWKAEMQGKELYKEMTPIEREDLKKIGEREKKECIISL